MLKATAEGDEGPVVMLGLSRGNVERLISNEPIVVAAGGDLGLNKRIVIFYGESEQKMLNAIRPAIGPDTKAHIDPKLGES